MADVSTTNPSNPSRGGSTCLAIVLGLGALIAATISGLASWREQDRARMERDATERRQEQFDEVKRGSDRAIIGDSRLLAMLADDADCVANLVHLDFAVVEIAPEDAKQVARLVHVRSMTFYSTGGVQHVLENSRSLPIERLAFEGSPVPPESLRSLGEFPRLKHVHIEDLVSPETIAILKSLPPTVTVKIPHLAESEAIR